MSTDEPPRARTLRFCPTPYAASALVESRPFGAQVLLQHLYRDAHQAGWSWLRLTIRDLADRYELKKHVVESLLDDLERAGLAEREIATSGGRSIGTRFRLFDPQLLTWSDDEARAVPVERRTSKPAATAHNGDTAGHDRRASDRVNRMDITRTSPRTSKPAATAHNGASAGHAAGHHPDACDRSTDRPNDPPPPKPPAAPRPGGSPVDSQLHGVIEAAARAARRDVRVDWGAGLVPLLLDELPDDEPALVRALEGRAKWLQLAFVQAAQDSAANVKKLRQQLDPAGLLLADRVISVLRRLCRLKDRHGAELHAPPGGVRVGVSLGESFVAGLEIWRTRPPDLVLVPLSTARPTNDPEPFLSPDDDLVALVGGADRARELGLLPQGGS
jgi:hypothetical protein